MRPAAIVLVAALALGVAAVPGWACMCAPPPPPLVALGRADGVFSGQVIRRWDPQAENKIISSASPVYYTFGVDDVWKGDVGDTVIVETARSSASCGYPFKMDETYLVYATRDSTGWRTHLCTRTRTLGRAADDLAAFAGADLTGSPAEIDERLVLHEIGRLSSGDQETRVAAAEALENMGQRPDLTAPALVDLYGRGTDTDRRVAVSALGRLAWEHPGAGDVKPTLLAALRDSSVDVRLLAIFRLSRMQEEAETIVPQLEAALADTSALVRTRAAGAIERMHRLGHQGESSSEPLLAAFESEDEASRGSALRALAASVPDSVAIRLAARALVEDPSANVRTSAVYALNKLEVQSAEVTTLLMAALHDPDESVRQQAVMGLAKAGEFGVDALPELRLALDDPSERVRGGAVSALAQLSPDHEEAWEELLAALDHHRWDVRMKAARGMVRGEEGDDQDAAAAALEAVLGDTSYMVVRSAAYGIVQLAARDPEAVEALVGLLSHWSSDVRQSAIVELGRLGPDAGDAVPALTALENDPDFKVSAEALRTLNRILRE